MIKNSQRFGIANCNGEEATTEQPFTTTVMKSLCWTKYTESLREQQYNPQVRLPTFYSTSERYSHSLTPPH